jgi:ketosteroid isomerase-like protein
LDSSSSRDGAARRSLLKFGLAAPLLAAAARPAFAASPGTGGDARSANKALVVAYVEACDRGDHAKLEAIIAPDAQWWILGRRDFDRKTLMGINRGRYPPGVARESQVLGIVAADDRVAVEYETTTLDNGVKGFSVFHHLFVVRNGAIASCREYLDPPPLAKPFAVTQAHPPGRTAAVPDPQSPENDARAKAITDAFVANGGPQTLSRELRAPDFRWWLPGYGYLDVDKYMSTVIGIVKSRPHVATVSAETLFTGTIVEGGRVTVQISRNLIYPNYDYWNRLHLVLIIRDGKVVELREHQDLGSAIRGGMPLLAGVEAAKIT